MSAMSIKPARSDDRLLALKEMAAYLSINERTLLKLVSEGEVPGVKIGSQWRFRKAMIDAWLDDQMLGVVVEELASLSKKLSLVRDETWFVHALIERENIMPSAVGNGVAFLHTMYRHPEQVVKPFMVLGRSARGVEFDALDNKATHLFFVLGLKFHELYLPWLAKLSQMFGRAEATRALLEAPQAEAIFEVLRTVEKDMFPERKERSVAS